MTFALWLLVIYLTALAAMYFLQRRLMYFPQRAIESPAHYGLTDFQDVPLRSADGVALHAWYRVPNPGRPLVAYFHGNAWNLSNRVPIFDALARQGFGVLAVSYRGYGASEGAPHETGIFDDARAAMHYAMSQGFEPSKMVLYGESLGTGVAVRMASEFGAGVLALQSPYTSVAGRAAEIYWFVPVRWLIHDKFESIGVLKTLNIPLLVFHGENDRTIPVSHGRAMLDASGGHKSGVFFPNVDHTDFDCNVLAQHLSVFADQYLHGAAR